MPESTSANLKPDPDSIEKPECEGGYTFAQLERILGIHYEDFGRWMRGQTMMLCEGRRYNYDTEGYVEACGGVAHGPVVYSWDLGRYLLNLPIID